MIADPADLAMYGLALAIGGVTALKPTWTCYVLSYGHPDRVSPKGRRALQFFAAWMALGALIGLGVGIVQATGLLNT